MSPSIFPRRGSPVRIDAFGIAHGYSPTSSHALPAARLCPPFRKSLIMGTMHRCLAGARDLVLLAGITGVANAFLDRADLGWLHLNPTPWLLPIALMGRRYGFTGGLTSGLTLAALVAVTRNRIDGLPMNEALHENAYYFLSLVISGALAGETSALLSRRGGAMRDENQKLTEENSRLRCQLQVTDETRHQLQQHLALINAPMSALDDELRTLLKSPEQRFAKDLLSLLHRLTGLTSAAIYLVDGGRLTQIAVLHPTPPLTPTTLSLSETPLAERALAAGALASVTDATDLTERQPFLAAFPWLDHLGRKSVILIQDMPFESFTLQNLARLELILSWASAIAVLRQTFVTATDERRPTSSDDFAVLLVEAAEAERIHSLPSVLLRLDFSGPKDLLHSLSLLPETAVSTRLPGNNSLAVLLPFSGETEALQTSRIISDAHPGVSTRHWLITRASTAADMWTLLQEP
jgi:hypothetical protein